MAIPSGEILKRVYGDRIGDARDRFEELERGFIREFGTEQKPEYFTAPGRTEIIGNHTDHNGGKVMAASIDLDTIGAASPNGTDRIRVISEGYEPVEIGLGALSLVPKEEGTKSLLAGMAEAVMRQGYQIGGFDLYTTSNVVAAAGISSSASFEMLIAVIVNTFFNEGKMKLSDYAGIGQYAENHFWNKASGQMDQMACAAGGTIVLDFSEKVRCEPISFDFERYGYRMIITNTGTGHADLSAQYSAVPQEMAAVAGAMGKERLCQVTLEQLLDRLPEIAQSVKNDRAILRAIHFLTETQRVECVKEKAAEEDIKEILSLMQASGRSSYELLQNCYLPGEAKEQPISMALALTELFLKKAGDGICRVHGGGFAGVIQAIVPVAAAEDYVQYMSRYYGRRNVYPMNIRSVGAVHLGGREER